MESSNSILYYINLFFLIYGVVLLTSYIIIAILSSFELSFYSKQNKFFNLKSIPGYKLLPSISIIAPSYNEEQSIIENIRSLLSLQYPKVEVIIVNDGSKDNTFAKVKAHYSLVRVSYAFQEHIKTAKIRGVYKSANIAYSNLIFIDKENGGKADALNAGINISRSDLFLAIDVDCIIEPDGISRMVKPFLEEEDGKKVIASGGVIRVANSCRIEDGRIVEVNFPKNIWADLQVLEYFRAFTIGRMAWGKINGLLIISGAFGLFDHKIAINVGGYDHTTVGEDLELVVRMRKYMHTVAKQPYKVAFIPDPLCWTEVPSSLGVLSRQRNRWTRGLIDTIMKHKMMVFNPRFGVVGVISLPYLVLFEWLAPIVEVIGVIYFALLTIFGRIDIKYTMLFMLFIFSFSLLYSAFAVLYEKNIFSRYKGYTFLIKIFLISILEMLTFHTLNVYFALTGNYDFFIKRNKKGWGKMVRTGFNSKVQQ